MGLTITESCKTNLLYTGLALYLILTVPSWSAPKDPENYTVQSGGFQDIPNGAYVEGSIRTGGTQPDYIIDLDSPQMKRILRYSRGVKEENLPYWEAIQKITRYINRYVFPGTDYEDPRYQDLIKTYANANTDIPISRYPACKSAVCREHAFITHFALKEAGIKNKHAYATIRRASNFHGFDITEDHAFVVIKHGNVEWVVDPYYWGFNGFKLQDLLSESGITLTSKAAPIARPGPGFRRIIKINDYPKIYRPINPQIRCIMRALSGVIDPF